MARRRTLLQNIRKYKQEYLRLLAYEARLNHQFFKMKKHIKLLAQEEELRLTEKAMLTEQLQKIQQQKTDLESQPASKQRNTQLKRIEKEHKQVKAKHSRNQYQLDQLEVRKDKDNAVKLLLKEAKLEDVRIRIQAAYETWMRLEQVAQEQLAATRPMAPVCICPDIPLAPNGNEDETSPAELSDACPVASTLPFRNDLRVFYPVQADVSYPPQKDLPLMLSLR
jgi:hypothetical protein